MGQLKTPKRIIHTVDDFKEFSDKFSNKNKMPFAFGLGINYKDSIKKETIATKWLTVNVSQNFGTAAAIMEFFDINLEKTSSFYQEVSKEEISALKATYFTPFVNDGKYHENVEVLNELSINAGDHINSCSLIFYGSEDILLKNDIESIPDAHFRLALMSRLKYKPNTLGLENLFSMLPTLAYTESGVYTVDEWNMRNWIKIKNTSSMVIIDKIPLLVWGAPIPEEVRMPNPFSARLGAYLTSGTTVMHYAFVNCNAGTLGPAMVEGTIAFGVVIGPRTNIGKGGGFLGTLSGGNKLVLYCGSDCLIGALAECGIPLGNNCVVAAGVVFTGNVPFVEIIDGIDQKPQKAIYFRDKDHLTFRRDSITGRMEVIHVGNKAELNPALHSGVDVKKEKAA